MDYDFCGWATRANLKCNDGRTIMNDAFSDNDGEIVPLVWNHDHSNGDNVLGHAILENRGNGVYAYGVFNDTPQGNNARELVSNGDITHLSIYANQLQQSPSGQVYHGNIREVSLVLAGANPGALIEDVVTHGDEGMGAIIYNPIPIIHSDVNNDSKTMMDIFDNMSEEEKQVVYYIIRKLGGGSLGHSDDFYDEGEYDMNFEDLTVDEAFDTLTPEQQEFVAALIDNAVDDEVDDALDDIIDDVIDATIDETVEGVYDDMKHNLFDNEYDDDVIMHSDIEAIFDEAPKNGSLRDTVLQHGITDIDYLFPDARNLNNPPEFITRKMDWVQKVMNGVHHTPFSRIKSQFADITDEQARAKGYLKGHLKKEEVFSLLKRSTTPTTVYKKQKIDRDDVLDITDFDVIAWLKTEMRMMLDEELARAFLVGDGRLTSDDDHINTDHIRPIWTDADLFTIKYKLDSDSPKDFIRGAIKSRIEYKGSGSPTLFITENTLTDLLLMTDSTGRDLYESEQKLATKLRVSQIITVPVLAGLVRTDTKTGKKYKLHGIIVNLSDYNVGADKGGSINMFDDFDIDYNAQKYLIETRCSGALVKPFSAISLETEVQTDTVEAPKTTPSITNN